VIEGLALAGRPAGETAVRRGAESLDRGTLAARAAAFADELTALPADALVGLRIGNEPAFLVAFLGCLAARRPAVLLDPLWTDAERRYASARVGAVALVQCETDALPGLGGWLLDAAGRLRARGAGADLARRPELADVAVVHWSSGTTGRPKPIVVPRAALDWRVSTLVPAFSLAPGDRMLCIVPLSHCHGLDCISLPTLAAGAELVLMDPLAATPEAVAQVVERQAVTHLSGLPRFWAQLLQSAVAPAALASLRVPLCGSAALPPDVARNFAACFGRRIRAGYGVTEIGVICCPGPQPSAGFDDVGPVLPGLQWRIDEPDAHGAGELWIRSPGDASGYLDGDADRVRTPDGWWRTQDLVREAAGGALAIVGRASAFINVNGSKADPREIEEVIGRLPWVAECAVRGLAEGGAEQVAAWVVPRAGAPAEPERDVQRAVAEALSAFKVPRRVILLDALPRSTLGKVLYARLPEPAAREREAVAPGDALECEIARLWGEVLRREHVSVVEDFFQQGGDSLRLAQLLVALRERFDPALGIVDLFRWPTVRAQAQALGGRRSSAVLDQSLELARRQREALSRRGRSP
jgi:acyl-CoA synthetase (AMP-forming)/AMP-acid ligase II/aryl carrier-like protein